jgi:hypothetical protein
MSNEESNIFIDWLEKSIYNEYLVYYDFSEFKNLTIIGLGGFARIFRANYINTNSFFAIKTFFEFNKKALKKLDNSIIKFCNKNNNTPHIYHR